MDLNLSPELAAVRATVREFVDRACLPREQEIEEQDGIPPDLLSRAAALGLFGLSIPTEYGGLGLSVLGRAVVGMELGRAAAGLTAVIGNHTGVGTSGIAELGSPEQKRHYLTRLATGEWIAAFALTEPDSGSDAAAIKTSAVRRGDRWVLNGSKSFITNAPEARLFTVIAVTDPARGTRGLSALLVERGTPGLSVGPPEPTMGLRGSHIATLTFTDCAISAENLLGAEGEGYRAATRILTRARPIMAARCVGAMERILAETVAYARHRVSFGKPIAEHQLIQAYLGEMATDLHTSRAIALEAAWHADRGEDVTMLASVAKLHATEAYGRVADKGVQVFGGLGYIRGTVVERFYRDARITRIYEGSTELQKLMIARRVLQ